MPKPNYSIKLNLVGGSYLAPSSGPKGYQTPRLPKPATPATPATTTTASTAPSTAPSSVSGTQSHPRKQSNQQQRWAKQQASAEASAAADIADKEAQQAEDELWYYNLLARTALCTEALTAIVRTIPADLPHPKKYRDHRGKKQTYNHWTDFFQSFKGTVSPSLRLWEVVEAALAYLAGKVGGDKRLVIEFIAKIRTSHGGIQLGATRFGGSEEGLNNGKEVKVEDVRFAIEADELGIFPEWEWERVWGVALPKEKKLKRGEKAQAVREFKAKKGEGKKVVKGGNKFAALEEKEWADEQ